MIPFSGKTRRLGHPQHPPFTHFPMALLMISTLWDLLGIWRGDSFWWRFSFWSIAVGLLFAIPAVVTGLIDYMKISQGGPAEGTATRHMLLVIAAATCYMGSFLVRFRSPQPTGHLLIGAVALSVIGLLLLVAGGWYGGELVYRYGAGRTDDSAESADK